MPDFCANIFNKNQELEEETYDSVQNEEENMELESLNENNLQIEIRDMNDDDVHIDNKQTTANRNFTKIESEVHKSKIEIYLKRYDSFIKSPRVHFVYDTAFYTAFLLLFSYVMLCDLSYYDTKNEETFLRNSSFIRIQNETYFEKNIVKNPSSLEYLLIFWIFSFICEEFSQVLICFLFFVRTIFILYPTIAPDCFHNFLYVIVL